MSEQSREGEQRKNQIVEDLTEAEASASALQEQAERIARHARFTRDLASATRRFVQAVPNDSALVAEDWDSFRAHWRQQKETTDTVLYAVTKNSHILTGTQSTTAVASVSAFLDFRDFEVRPEVRQLPAIRQAVEEITAVLLRNDLMPQIRAAMVELGLNHSRGTIRSALEILEEAKSAFDAPPGGDGPIGALISLREAVNAAIAELLRRRPDQQKAKSIEAQIASIGAQCGKDGTPASLFVCLGADAKYVIDSLSEAKEKHRTRAEQTLAFNAGLQLLLGFLECVDPLRLRKPASS